jgi:prophage antirepressor-like protein
MMSAAITPFSFEGASLRTLTDGTGAVWFSGKDAATALGYSRPRDAIAQHCYGAVKRRPIVDQLGRSQEMVFISEPDLYRLIASSKLPTAKKFERWIFEEVLPSIRKTGGYLQNNAQTNKELSNALCDIAQAIGNLTRITSALLDKTERLDAEIKAEKARRRVSFTETEKEQMLALWREGFNKRQIARRIERNVNSVCGFLRNYQKGERILNALGLDSKPNPYGGGLSR